MRRWMSILAAATARFFARWRCACRREIFSASSVWSVGSCRCGQGGDDRQRAPAAYGKFVSVRYLLPSAPVETFYLLFPDPWPKRRHWRLRIVNDIFLRAISQALVSSGTLCIATDRIDYFDKIKEIGRANPDFAAIKCGDVDLPHTKFERKFRAQDAPIYRLELRKHSPVR